MASVHTIRFGCTVSNSSYNVWDCLTRIIMGPFLSKLPLGLSKGLIMDQAQCLSSV